MIQLNGTIQKITKENNNGKEKKVVTLQAGKHNTLFIEFQGNMIEKLEPFQKGSKIEVSIRFNGKESALGRKYNNIIAKTIKSI